MVRAAVYGRRSTPDEVNVRQQIDRGRELCEREGWQVAGEWMDDGKSAWKPDASRPGFDALMEEARAGSVDYLVARHVDRVARRDSYEWVDLDRLGVKIVEHGSGQPMTALEATIKLAIARQESDVKSGRQLDAIDREVEAGKPPRGGHRHYGYHSGTCCPVDGCPHPDARIHRVRKGEDDDHVCGTCEGGCTPHAVNEREAAILRDVAKRYLAGEPLRALARELEERDDVPTIRGGKWTNVGLRKTLRSPRLAGWRVHRRNGEVRNVRLKNWTPIFSDDLHAKLIDASGAKNRRAPQRYLLTGLIECGRCGATVNGKRHTAGTPRYACLACSRCSIPSEPVDKAAWNAALGRTWKADRLDDKQAQEALGGAERELADVEAQIIEWDDDKTAGRVTRERWARQTAKLGDRAAVLRDNVDRLRVEAKRATNRWESRMALADAFEVTDPAERRRILDGAVDKMVLHPGVRGRFDLGRVEVTWADGTVERLGQPDGAHEPTSDEDVARQLADV